MFKGFLTACALLLTGAAAQAQDITVPMHLIAPGSVITIQTSTGQVYTHHMRGRTPGGDYWYETYNGHGVSGTAAWVQYADGFGNLTRRVDPRGQTTHWTPHRCNRTLGSCNYVETRPNGVQAPFTRITSPSAGGFTYQLYDSSGATALTGEAHLGQFGWTQWGWSQRNGEAATTVEILSTNFR